MIVGFVEIEGDSVHTHNASYRLDVLKVAKAPRSYLSSAVLLSGAFVGFGIAFWDILWPGELATITIGCAAILLFGWYITHLTFHSRDLTGTAVSGALLGTHGHLNRIRREVMSAQAKITRGDLS